MDASDRDSLLGWLLERPLAHYDGAHHDLLVHAGLVPQWHAQQAAQLAGEVESALRRDPRAVLSAMYGDEPDRWEESLSGEDRLRFIINVLTRCGHRAGLCGPAAEGSTGGKPRAVDARFKVKERASAAVRVIFGHWSTLGFHRGDGVLALDTGCVWGGALTGVNLDDPDFPPVAVQARRNAAAS